MDQNSVSANIGYLRIGVGALAWAAPDLTGRLFGLDPAGNPQAAYLGRLFGIRDVALGAGLLIEQGNARRTWLKAGLGCDVADAAAAILGRRAGYLSTPGALLLVAPALSGVAFGIVALRAGDSPRV